MARRATSRGKPRRATPTFVLVGGGGHAVVVAEAGELGGWRVGGFLDDATDAPAGEGWTRLGGLCGPPARYAKAPRIVCVGDVALRRKIIENCTRDGEWATIVHPTAYVSASARIGAGVFVGPQAVVHARAAIGDHVVINSGAIIEHDCSIGENVHVAPGAVVAGGCRVGADVLIGVGARVVPRVSIGTGAVVGAGAVVLENVPARATVVGVPARAVDGR